MAVGVNVGNRVTVGSGVALGSGVAVDSGVSVSVTGTILTIKGCPTYNCVAVVI